MKALCITHDESRCILCRACEIHCQVWHGAPAGVHPARLCVVEPHSPGDGKHDGSSQTDGQRGTLALRAAFVHCFHCDDPPCLRVCPTTAMRRRARDGIVYIVQGLCTGCRACVMACPWRVPCWSASLERMFKCDLCRERLDAELLPACVSGCTTGALRLSTDAATVAAQHARRTASLRHGGETPPEEGQGGGTWSA